MALFFTKKGGCNSLTNTALNRPFPWSLWPTRAGETFWTPMAVPLNLRQALNLVVWDLKPWILERVNGKQFLSKPPSRKKLSPRTRRFSQLASSEQADGGAASMVEVLAPAEAEPAKQKLFQDYQHYMKDTTHSRSSSGTGKMFGQVHFGLVGSRHGISQRRRTPG